MTPAIPSLRKQLAKAALRESPGAKPFIATLQIQLKGFAKADDKSALIPEIEKTIARIERERMDDRQHLEARRDHRRLKMTLSTSNWQNR